MQLSDPECRTAAESAVNRLVTEYHAGTLVDIHDQPVNPHDNEVNRVLFLSVGGTALSAKNTDGRRDSSVPLAEGIKHLNLAQGPAGEQVIPCELFNADSSHFKVPQWRLMAESIAEIRKKIPHGIKGVILLHGTDTLALGTKYIPYMLGRGFNKPLVFVGTQHSIMSGLQEPGYKIRNAIHATIAAAREGVADYMTASHTKLFSALQTQKRTAVGDEIFGPYNGEVFVDFGANSDHESWIFAGARRRDEFIEFDPFTDLKGSDSDILNLNTVTLGGDMVAKLLRQTRGAVLDLYGSSTQHPAIVDVVNAYFRAGKPIVLGAPFLDAVRPVGFYEVGHGLEQQPHLNATFEALAAKIHWASNLAIREYLRTNPEAEQPRKDSEYGLVYAPDVLTRICEMMKRQYLGELVENIEPCRNGARSN